ncbi:MAG: phosphoribosylformylglycinamidine synthase II, partial [Acidimicrobiia bacterium]|nr:phosphoribosylformylglycinamidine synthase II [Acidimicrobiia bacterium]
GIGGASILASASFDESSGAKRPSVQVGDPFEEKKLIEACLELYERKLVVAVQDLGAAGISCATSEVAGGSGMGMDVALDAVHLREHDMNPGEILMSESQERMLAIVTPDDVDEVLKLAEKWEIDAAVIGTLTEGPLLRIEAAGELVAEVPAASLADDAPIYHRPLQRPETLDATWEAGPHIPADLDVADALLQLLDDPAIGDRSWIYEQYDHQLFLNTVVEPGHDASLLRVKGTDKGLAVSTDGDGLRCLLDPRRGSARIVFEAALNVAVTGARPLAVVDNLNFGNPEKPEVMWQFVESVEGLSEACEALGIPVVGGNVSFYNETDGTDILPSPVVGLLGLADPVPESPPRLDAAAEGMQVWLVGAEDSADLAGSALARVVLDNRAGRPAPVDPDLGPGVIAAAADLARTCPVVHDISSGGLAVAVAEIAIRSGVGITIDITDADALFSEGPHRIVVCTPTGLDDVGVPARRIGTVGGDAIILGDAAVDVERAATAWRDALRRRLD